MQCHRYPLKIKRPTWQATIPGGVALLNFELLFGYSLHRTTPSFFPPQLQKAACGVLWYALYWFSKWYPLVLPLLASTNFVI